MFDTTTIPGEVCVYVLQNLVALCAHMCARSMLDDCGSVPVTHLG